MNGHAGLTRALKQFLYIGEGRIELVGGRNDQINREARPQGVEHQMCAVEYDFVAVTMVPGGVAEPADDRILTP